MINLKNVFKKTLADILRKNVFQMKNIFFSKFLKCFLTRCSVQRVVDLRFIENIEKTCYSVKPVFDQNNYFLKRSQ